MAQQLFESLATGPPQRSTLFVALTAEEKGLLGAFHFAAHPTVPTDSLVANVNIDMPLLVADVTDVIPVGIEHSTLQVEHRHDEGALLRIEPASPSDRGHERPPT